MDEEALVEALVSEGAQLEAALRSENKFSGASIVARDVELNEWKLLIPLPRGSSRLGYYEFLQGYVSRLDLDLALDRIMLVRDNDPGLRELRGATSRAYMHRSWQTVPIEVAGRSFADPLTVRIEPRVFEQQVMDALKEVLPGFEVRPSRDLKWLGNFDLAARNIPLPVDLALIYRELPILIEIKASRCPLGLTPVLTAYGALTYVQRVLDRPARMAIISISGYSDRVVQAFEGLPDIALVAWQPHQGAHALAASIEHLANGLRW